VTGSATEDEVATALKPMASEPLDFASYLGLKRRGHSAFRHEPQIPSESKIVSVSKSSEPMQGFVLETASLSGAQIAPVPLPLRKPERRKGAKANPATQKRMAQQKRAQPKPMR
jgi:hypothetical protein